MPHLSWGSITSADISFRDFNGGFIFDSATNAVFLNNISETNYILGYLNSKFVNDWTKIINPTLNFTVTDFLKLPYISEIKFKEKVDNLVQENIRISKQDWDSFETSWDFKKHPLVSFMIMVGFPSNGKYASSLKITYDNWESQCNLSFNKLKHNEEELNRIFIDIYGLQDELTPEVEDKNITVRKANKVRDVKSLISYAVGCMFGRYSLDKDGLVYAGGTFDENNYKTFKVDNDNIIPITDEAYFSDDIVERFKTFIKTVYGDNTFNENMDFIAEALGKKGTETSEETIRRYFVNDFFNDHVKMYQKRPIYWLLDSGKKNGFKALVYMHRYNENLIPKARLDYLHRVQTTYEKLLSDVNYRLTTELSMTDKKEAKNRQADLNAKLNEIKEYDEKIAHIANQRISIDLDDGVKVNYEKFKDILAKIK